MGIPPVFTGAVQNTVTCESPAVPNTLVGAPGALPGITVFETADGTEIPTLFLETTEKE